MHERLAVPYMAETHSEQKAMTTPHHAALGKGDTRHTAWHKPVLAHDRNCMDAATLSEPRLDFVLSAIC